MIYYSFRNSINNHNLNYIKLVSLNQRSSKSVISIKQIIVVIAAMIVMEHTPNTSVLLPYKFVRKQHKNYQKLFFNLFKEKKIGEKYENNCKQRRIKTTTTTTTTAIAIAKTFNRTTNKGLVVHYFYVYFCD